MGRYVDMAAMMYNPNNVATEASPYTTGLERQVGEDLCRMLGYGYGVGGEDSDVEPWGHITCVSKLFMCHDDV
jgi:hypothetical protein